MLQNFEHSIENERQRQLLDERCENICLAANVPYLPPHQTAMQMPVSTAAMPPQQPSAVHSPRNTNTNARAAAAPAATAAAAPR